MGTAPDERERGRPLLSARAHRLASLQSLVGRKIGLNWQFLCDDHDAGHRHTVNATGNLAPLKTRSRRPLGLVGNSLASELFIDKNHPCFGVPNSSQQCKATLDLEATLTLMVWFGFGRRDCVYGISTLMHPE